MRAWLGEPGHERWLIEHGRALLAFGRRTGEGADGAAWLDLDGNPDAAHPAFAWHTARMVHVYALGALEGIPGCAPVAAAVMRGLHGPLRDTVNGGWFTELGSDGPTDEKACYSHVHIVLGAASATHAGLPGARELFDEACATLLRRFWDDGAGMLTDSWDAAFTRLDPYRGINANMHGVEAMLAAASLTGDTAWLNRAERVSRFVVAAASANGWRIPEHYDEAWRPLLDHHGDQPAHPFKPYGATIGHSFEWARLIVHLRAARGGHDRGLLDAAASLYDTAAVDGWAPDGEPGFVYTIDWDGTPVVADRLHWVLCEAIGAAAAMYAVTGDQRYARDYRAWWDHAAAFHLDHRRGGWFQQLDAHNRPATSVWSGKPDLYHSYQATLVPRLALWPMMAAALDRGG